MIRLG